MEARTVAIASAEKCSSAWRLFQHVCRCHVGLVFVAHLNDSVGLPSQVALTLACQSPLICSREHNTEIGHLEVATSLQKWK